MTAPDRIQARSQLAAGFIAPRSGDVAVAAAGLDRMRRLVDTLGNPQRTYTTIHVAGSKGKGSTAAYAAAILTATGRRTGLYTSPHLMDWHERIAVDGTSISADAFDRVLAYVDSAMGRLEAERPGETPHNAFELLTAAAFVHFAEVGCDAAVIEVGIGGRFDSTNVVDADVAVITSIQAEHLDILGPTFADVAWNKAGIIRGGRPCVSVAQQPAALRILTEEADAVAAELAIEGRDWSVSGTSRSFTVETPRGRFFDLAISNPMAPQMTNAAAAVVATSLLASPTPWEIQAGLDAGTLPGRFEVFPNVVPVVLDVAHTPSSIAAVGDAVGSAWPARPVVAVIGLLTDKDLASVAAAVAGWADSIVTTTSPSPRAISAADIATGISAAGQRLITSVDDPSAALGASLQAAGEEGVVVVTGSFAVVARIRELLLASE